MTGKPFFILEAGVNHDGSVENAMKLIEAASKTGADAIKFQTYTAEKLAAQKSPAYWDKKEEPTESQFELFKKYDGFSLEDYESLAKKCKDVEIEFMTTCFDEDWVDALDHLLLRYKVASADITNFPLLKKIASKEKPMILSTGAAKISEVVSAVDYIHKNSKASLSILHCVLNYPTSIENASLDRITQLREVFPELTIGYSDHTKSLESVQSISTAFVLGARIFEKHFTLSPTVQGNDHYHSFTSAEAKSCIDNLSKIEKSLKYQENEFLNLQADARLYARRGVYLRRDVQPGEVMSIEDLICLRPTVPNGIDPTRIFLGAKFTASLPIKAHEPLTEINSIAIQTSNS
jgi:N-acetylneuraminate synthase